MTEYTGPAEPARFSLVSGGLLFRLFRKVHLSVPLTVLQNQLRHADVKTTLRVYSHVIPQTQRDAMEQVGGFQS